MSRKGKQDNVKYVMLVLISILAYQILLIFLSYSHINLLLTFVNIGLIALIYFVAC